MNPEPKDMLQCKREYLLHIDATGRASASVVPHQPHKTNPLLVEEIYQDYPRHLAKQEALSNCQVH
jgi:hypothetical protein